VILNIALSKDWKTWLLEVHNPTDKTMVVKVKNSPYIAGIKFAETLKLSPGTSQFRTLGPVK
jgi:hypothetical protein